LLFFPPLLSLLQPALLLVYDLYILIAAMNANELLTQTWTNCHGLNVSDMRNVYYSWATVITPTTKVCTLIAVRHIISEYS
jgi:hypothetical protein